MHIINNYIIGMISRSNVMIGIWIVFISRMTTTFIFKMMTLLHLMYITSRKQIRSHL
jgi:hypothetical protein